MTTKSIKSVATRLAIRPGDTICVLNAPGPLAKLLRAQLPPGAQIVKNDAAPVERVVVFAANSAELENLLPAAIAATKPNGALWVAYPKIASGRSDLSRQIIHDNLHLSGWKPVAQISVDDVWSAVRARPATEAERRRV
jgi:hypothetical protein